MNIAHREKTMDLLESLDMLADGDDLHVEPEMRAHIWDRFLSARLSEGLSLAFDGHGRPFDEFCAVWADNIRGEQHDDEARTKGWETV